MPGCGEIGRNPGYHQAMRRWFAMVVAAALALLVVWWMTGSGPTPVPVPAARPRAEPQPRRGVVQAPRVPKERRAPEVEPAPAGAAAEAYGRVAEALGVVAVRCHVGSQLDGVRFQHMMPGRIEQGWYTELMYQLEGARLVRGRLPNRDEEELLFRVRWKAEHPGASVPCQVEWLDYGTLEVELVDTVGQAVVGVNVFGCNGLNGVSDARGRVEGTVVAGEPCVVFAAPTPAAFSGEDGAPVLGGHDTFSALGVSEVRRERLVVEALSDQLPYEFEEPREWSLLGSMDSSSLLDRAVQVRALAASADDEEAAVLEELAASAEEAGRAILASEERLARLQEIVEEMERLQERPPGGGLLDGEQDLVRDLMDLMDETMEEDENER